MTKRQQNILVVGGTIFVVLALGWILYEIAKYDGCLDSIDYDRTRWHLCD
jgi:hypothetical protein